MYHAVFDCLSRIFKLQTALVYFQLLADIMFDYQLYFKCSFIYYHCNEIKTYYTDINYCLATPLPALHLLVLFTKPPFSKKKKGCKSNIRPTTFLSTIYLSLEFELTKQSTSSFSLKRHTNTVERQERLNHPGCSKINVMLAHTLPFEKRLTHSPQLISSSSLPCFSSVSFKI